MNLKNRDFARILEKLVESDFKPPFRFCWVGLNGSVIAGTYRPDPSGFAVETTVRHVVGTGLELPVNALLVDADGVAAHVRIGISGEVEPVAMPDGSPTAPWPLPIPRNMSN